MVCSMRDKIGFAKLSLSVRWGKKRGIILVTLYDRHQVGCHDAYMYVCTLYVETQGRAIPVAGLQPQCFRTLTMYSVLVVKLDSTMRTSHVIFQEIHREEREGEDRIIKNKNKKKGQ